MQSKLVTADTSLIFPVRNEIIKALHLSAAAANSTLEVFDGTMGTVATVAVGAGGANYEVGDQLTLAQAGGGVQAVVEVATLSGSAVATVTVISGGTGYTAGATYATVNSETGSDDNCTITVSTVTDSGTSIAKLECLANTSAPPLSFPCGLQTTAGISARITGSGAKAYIYHD